MRKSASFLVLSAFFAFATTSCQDNLKDVTQTQVKHSSNAEADPEQGDDMLRFKSIQDFEAYMKEHQDMTPIDLMAANKERGFISHLRLNEEPDLEPAHPVAKSALHCLGPNPKEPQPNDPEVSNVTEFEITDPLLASVLNVDREVQIGDLIARPGNDYTFFYPVGQAELIDKFYEQLDAQLIKMEDGEVRAIDKMVVMHTNLVTNPKDPNAPNLLGNRSIDVNGSFDDKHRIEAQIWEGNWFFYASSGIKTHATQYARKWVFFWGWVDLKCQTVTAKAEVTYQQRVSPPGTWFPIFTSVPQTATVLSISENNAAVAVKRFDWAVAQIGYTNNSGGVSPQVQAILSQMVVNVPNPRGTVTGATQTIRIDRLESKHTGLWNNRTANVSIVW